MSSLSDKIEKRQRLRFYNQIYVKCKKCNGDMVRVQDLREDTVVGYS